jgi:preprotein translocase subunit SecE
MEKEKESTASPVFRELVHLGLYKRSQGRIARQATFGAIVAVIALGIWRLSQILDGQGPTLRFALPGVLLLVGLWLAYRVVNVPRFADFLISVEAEMSKVSWPTRGELFRSSLVVLVTIFVLGVILFLFDAFWKVLLTFLGV